MKRTRNIALRVLVALVASAFLLLPSFMAASVLSVVNFVVTLPVLLISILVAAWLPRWRWIGGVITSFLVAIPPYPFWLYIRENGDWYLNMFHGFTLQKLPLGTFGVVFVLALLLFATIFWAIGKRVGQDHAATAIESVLTDD